ncbi:CPSF A subunit region-domain-containing protein [Clohesyomyces aquaticus]|uniref:CPSF A subunit region-domain-containing protein n=1 Tax=Clohesyomyces aquaticus TaxID=1231657 RepID=A0A1Y2A228_9PLEO|nr:CPSF A subunit region-domain-containing protein [Clohesyomyces aquaticus]
MMAAIEKDKLVWTLSRTGQTDVSISISSPLGVHRPQTLVYYALGMDVGYENPIFALLEVDYSESDADPSGEAFHEVKKELSYYELDLGLNHVVHRGRTTVDRTANMLFRVPGGNDLPSGVLCCGEDNISYYHVYEKEVFRLAIPRREGAAENPNRKRYIVAGTLYTLKGGNFFYLLQTEDGDVFKVTFDIKSGKVERLNIWYFDTIPVASSICLLRAGFVYCASEAGDRLLYELETLGDEHNEHVFSSDQFPTDPTETYNPPYFQVRPLRNLNPVEKVANMSPVMDMEVANLSMEDAPQIYTVSGTGARSTFRTTRNALDVLELVDSQLPQRATSVWTAKLRANDEHDTYIVLSLVNHTLVLRIGDDVEEAQHSGLLAETTTLGVQQFGEDCIIQIHPKGIRHIRTVPYNEEDPTQKMYGEITDWKTPAHRSIVACAANNRQVCIALSSGEIYYFACDYDSSLAQAEDEAQLDHTIHCLAMPDVPEGRQGSDFLAVGCGDKTFRIFNLNPRDQDHRILGQTGLMGLSALPHAIAFHAMKDQSPAGYSLYAHVGLHSGIYVRALVDEFSGTLSGFRRRFLGPAPVKFARVSVGGEPAILALTTRPWLAYTHPVNNTLALTPLNYMSIEAAWSFESASFKGIICVRGEDLRIVTLDDVDLSQNLSYEQISLQYTPRKLVGNHEQQVYYVIESDNNTLDAATRDQLKREQDEKVKEEVKSEEESEDKPMKTAEEEDLTNGELENDEETNGELLPVDFGLPKVEGRWASCIQVVDPVTEKAVIHTIELRNNQCAVSAALIAFESKDNDLFFAVGVAQDLKFTPYSFSKAFIQLYKVSPDGRKLEFYHDTEVSAPPLALLAFKGKLIAGLGNDLVLFDCGLKHLLRKAQASNCTGTRITDLKTQGSRIVVADQSQSVTYVVHKDMVHPNRLIPFADDTVPRWTTCAEMADYDTTVGGDKFGNIWIVRCPEKVSQASDESEDGQHLIQDKAYLGGAPNRLDLCAHYFTNDIPTAIQKTNLIAGGDRIIFWAGLQGTLGVFVPFESRRDHKMFQQLELLLRNEEKPIAGRDHLAYRSYYTPIKNVIDGDLVERFLTASNDEKASWAAQLDGAWDASSVEDKIWTMRLNFAF